MLSDEKFDMLTERRTVLMHLLVLGAFWPGHMDIVGGVDVVLMHLLVLGAF